LSFAVKLKKTLFRAAALRIVTLGLDLLFFGYILKRLPVDEVGLYSWVVAVVMFAGLFLDLGVNYVVVRDISSGKDVRKTLLGTMGMRVPVYIALVVIYLAWYRSGISSETVYRCVLFMGMTTAILYFENILLAYLRAREWQTTCNLSLAFNSLLRLSAGFYVLDILGSRSVLVLVEGLLGAKLVNLASVVLLFLVIRRKLKPGEPEGGEFVLRAHVRASLTMLAITGLGMIQLRADWLMIERWLDKAALANYALSNKVLEILNLVWLTVLQTVFPWQCRVLGSGESSTSHSLFYGLSALAGVLAGFGTLLFAPYLVKAVFGDKYAMAIPALKVHALVFSFGAVCTLLYQSFVALGLEKQLFRASFVFISIQMLMDVMLIRSYGIVSAAFAMLVSYVVCLAFYVWYADKKRIVTFKEQKRLLLPLALSVCMVVALHIDMNVWLKLAVFAALAYVAVFRIYLSRDERAYVFGVLRG